MATTLETLKVPAAYKKALAAFFVPFVGYVGIALEDGHVDGAEALTAVGSALLAFVAAYGFRNADVNR